MKKIIYCFVFLLFTVFSLNISGKQVSLFNEDDTVKMLEKEVEMLLNAEVITNVDSVDKAHIYSQLGDILSSKYCYLSSLEYYLKAFEEYIRAGDIKGACSSLAAKAKSEFMLAQYDKSIASYKKALSMAGSIKDTNSTINILNCLSAVMLYSSNSENSKIKMMESGVEAIGIPMEQLTALCVNAAVLDKELKNGIADNLYLSSDEKIKDSLNKAGDEFITDFNLLKSKLAQTAALNKKIAEREAYIIGFFTILFLLLAGCGVYVYKMSKKQQKALELHNIKAGEQINSLSTILERKIIGFKRFLDASSYKRERPQEFLAEFKRYINIENGRIPDAFGDIIDIANLYHNGIINRLRLQYPSLNNEEIYMCALIALDFPISSIKFIYNHASDDSMYNKRARLKKKLGLGPDERPEKYIKELILHPIALC